MSTNALAQALKTPSVVLVAGERPAQSRNSIKKTSGLLRFGAGIMLGAALLSPLNALAQGPVPAQVWEQTTEVVASQAQQQATPSTQATQAAADGMEEMSIHQLQELLDQGQEPDWFSIQVEGRNWHNAPTPQGVAISVRDWISEGDVVPSGAISTQQDLSATESMAQLDAMFLKLKQDRQARRDAQEAQRQAQYELQDAQRLARRESEAIDARRDAPSFSPTIRNEYDLHKKIALGKYSLEDAAPQEREAFIVKLVQDAYIEMRAGHDVDAPSQRLIDICHHVEDVAKTGQDASHVPNAPQVFAACNSDAMQGEMILNSALKIATGAGIIVLAGLTRLASSVGYSAAASMATGVIDLLADRRKRRPPSGPSDPRTTPRMV